ncbi:MAG: trimethylamine methyltransferase family protein [Gammaproteobacteria bacterium]|nr:trimethylamine methyltransferase family protein [Gammaproteobacteria bacterium]
MSNSKRRGGRSARMAHRREAEKIQAPRFMSRNIPCYDLLREEELVRIEDHADWILQEVGIEFWGDDESIALFKEAGASVDGRRLRFDKGHIQSLCATAPKEFEMLARNPERSTIFGGNRLIFAPAYGSPFVYDLKGGRRQGTITDFENFIKLTYMTPWLHHQSGTVCEPTDIAVNKRHLDMVYAHLKYSDKPFMGSVTAPERAGDSIAMARIVFGDELMENNCVIQGNINVNSPLVYDDVMSGALKAYARANQGTVISPFILGGAMSPVTMPGAIAQAHAETLAGIALTQLVRKGAPVVYGNFLTTMDLKSGAPTFGTPESTLAGMAVGQLARRLGLPFRCGGHYTASKVTDAQAMQESADSMLSGFLAGANFIHQSAGWLEGGLVIGYEKFILDSDRLGMLHRTAEGMTIDANTLATSAFIENEPGKNFLGTDHTGQNFETANFRSEMPDNNSFEQWSEDGSKDAEVRAYERWKKMLDEYQPPELDPSVDEALVDFMRQKKDSMADEWY